MHSSKPKSITGSSPPWPCFGSACPRVLHSLAGQAHVNILVHRTFLRFYYTKRACSPGGTQHLHRALHRIRNLSMPCALTGFQLPFMPRVCSESCGCFVKRACTALKGLQTPAGRSSAAASSSARCWASDDTGLSTALRWPSGDAGGHLGMQAVSLCRQYHPDSHAPQHVPCMPSIMNVAAHASP